MMREGVAITAGRVASQGVRRQSAFPREPLAGLVLAGSDFVVAGACLAAGEWLVPGQPYFATTWALALVWPFMLWREGLYPAYGVHRAEKLRGYVIGILSSLVVLAVIRPLLFPSNDLLLVAWVGATMAMLPLMYAVRVMTQRLLQMVGLWGRSILVLGAGATGSRIVEGLVAQPLLGLTPVAVFDDDERKVGRHIAGIPVVGDLASAQPFASKYCIEHAVLAMPRSGREVMAEMAAAGESPFKRLQIVPDLPGMPVATVQASNLNDLLALEVRNNLKIPRNRLVKRVFDLVVATLGTLAISPILLFIALLICIDSQGPALYTQERIGMGGRHFHVWKFRTMVRDADAVLQRDLETNPELMAEWVANHKLNRDPRVTRIGRFLRKSSLDELPQLINVFRGDMSLVGPRPIVDAEVGRYRDQFDLYALVRPGMTGYWQISGRSETSYDRRVELDGFYTRNWSIWFDFVILFATIRVVVRGRGAF